MVVTKFETQNSRLESYAELVFVSMTEHAAYISVIVWPSHKNRIFKGKHMLYIVGTFKVGLLET